MSARSRTQRALKIGLTLLGLALALGAWVAWDNWGRQAPAGRDPAARLDDPARIAQGAYLARAGNCAACHTARAGAPLAGGRPIETPFGTVYSSNLTPDAETGLGAWNAREFWTALYLGRSRDGRLLTPAFPYNHTSVITREDSDALFAWLRQQTPVRQANAPHALRWPTGTQAALAVWRSLYFRPAPFQPDPQQSAAWNRGAYLVQGLGHCAACHSPRNALGASGPVDDLSGGRIPGLNWYATNLLSERESGLASMPLEEMVRLLRTGQNATASTSGPMGEVVQHGLQHLSPEDLGAMATYLQARARAQPALAPAPATPPSPARAQQGRKVYEAQCAQCHGDQGQGAGGLYPALAGNRAVLLDDPTNLVRMVLHGGFGPATSERPRPFGMPPYVLSLSDADIAAVLTHLRSQWGHQAPEVTPLQVLQIRAGSGN